MRAARRRDAAAPAQAEWIGEVPLGLAPHLGPPAPTAAAGERSWWRRHRSTLTSVLGLAAAAAGALLSSQSSTTAVYLDTAGYHVGSTTLAPAGARTYANGGVVIISPGARGSIDAASSLELDGTHITGSCHMEAMHEHCSFRIGGTRSLTADDTLRGDTRGTWWARRYGDGVTTSIEILNGVAVPVPLPLNR